MLAVDAAAWSACGFTVVDDACQIGGVRLRFAGPEAPAESPPGQAPAAGATVAPGAILGWSLGGVQTTELDGLPTRISHEPPRSDAPAHPNGVTGIDHIVAISPDFERSVTALQAAGLDLRRVREQPTPAGAPRQAFFRLGSEILELIQEPEEAVARRGRAGGPARFWGLALVAQDIERTAAALAPNVGEVRAAVQPGRRIATVRREAGLGVPVALMTSAPSAQGAPA